MTDNRIIYEQLLDTLEEIADDNTDNRAVNNKKFDTIAVALIVIFEEIREINKKIGVIDNESKQKNSE